MRISSNLKLHGLKGPRINFPLQEADVRENEEVYITADGIAIADGEGKILRIETIATTDAGGSRIYDETSAAGQTLSGAYAAKAVSSVINNYDPPKYYKHGVYVDLTTAVVSICYKPFGRNLRSRLTVAYAPGTLNLVSRVTTRNSSTKDLIARLTGRKMTSKNLLARNITRQRSTKNLVNRVTVYFVPLTSDLLMSVTTLRKSTKDLLARETTLNKSSKNLQMQVHVQWIAP